MTQPTDETKLREDLERLEVAKFDARKEVGYFLPLTLHADLIAALSRPSDDAVVVERRCELCSTSAPEAFTAQCNRPECPYRPSASAEPDRMPTSLDPSLEGPAEPESGVGEIVRHLEGPHEWGYRDPVVGGFIEDDAPFKAADILRSRPDAGAEAMRSALEFIADAPDPGAEQERSATFYRLHAGMLKQVAAKALGRETVSPEAMAWADEWANSEEGQPSITDAMIDAGAAGLEPELFCGDPKREHRAASPISVDYAKDVTRRQAKACLIAALNTNASTSEGEG